jgi:transcriptional regulator with XRE-family HTH domain
VPHAKLASLGSDVRKHRTNRKLTLREAAREIGISPATLMRVESGRIPDVDTFGKLCVWLAIDPRTYLGIKIAATDKPRDTTHGEAKPSHMIVSAHFKADRTPNQDTVKALANMIMFAAASQRQKATVTDGDP